MESKSFVTKQYLKSLSEIEDFIWEQTNKLKCIESFLQDHDRVRLFIEQNPYTPAPNPQTGDQSWFFANGRYRVFFKSIEKENIFKIYFLDLIDNRMLNQKIYPENSLPTYDVD